MQHARPDYVGRIIDLHGKIPEDEPVFLVRGQDACAPATMRFWAAENNRRGGNPVFSNQLVEHALRCEEWQRTHVCKLAD